MKLFLKLGTAIALISGAVPALALDNSSSQKADMTDKATVQPPVAEKRPHHIYRAWRDDQR